jgi:hypothetical protein
MSPENSSPGASRAAAVTSEGRRLPERQPSAQEASGGVSVDSMSGSASREGWEVCGSEATQPSDQAGATGQAEAAGAEVGVLHSIADLLAMDAEYRAQLRQSAGREGTCSEVPKRSEGQGDGPRGIQTPAKVRKLPIALYRKAKADNYAFYGLWPLPVTAGWTPRRTA